MNRKHTAALVVTCAVAAHGHAAPNDPPNDPNAQASTAAGNAIETIEVTAQRLNDKRSAIGTQTGASTYTIDEGAIEAMPGADNSLLNRVMLQAPDVVQDSFGQFHVRGDHNDLQYRLNGIILPEGINVFGQSLSPRPISALQLITGALPAQYGLRTAGIIDITTKNGMADQGGAISAYGGSNGTFQPSIVYGGGSDNVNYFVTADYLSSNKGIESPDRSTDPLHDDTTQYHGFAYLEDILDPDNRLSLMAGTSNGKFQIPNQGGLTPSLGLTVLGITDFPSQALDENQRELTNFATIGWQHSQGALDFQTSLTTRFSRLAFTPSPIGDLLYDGIAQNAYKRDVGYSWQADAALSTQRHAHAARRHVRPVRRREDRSDIARVADRRHRRPDQRRPDLDRRQRLANAMDRKRLSAGRMAADFFVDRQLRTALRPLDGFSNGDQVSPRFNVVWKAAPDTTLHAGYSRYFTPPPFELVGSETIAKFANTTAAPEVTQATPPKAERADYYDVGMQQVFDALTLGVDGYYRHSCI